MSLADIYKTQNQNNDYSNINCNSIDTNSLSFNGVDTLTTFQPDYLQIVKTTAQLIPTATDTTIINYDTKSGSLSGEFNETTGVWTVGSDGYYLISSNLSFANNNTLSRKGELNISSSENVKFCILSATGIDTSLVINTIRFLSASDTVSLLAYQNSGGNLNVNRVLINIAKINA